ncbi:DUF5937 family protein [Microbacterium sp. JZ101]
MHRKLVEFRLRPDDVSAIRFGISPGHELVHAVRSLARPAENPLQWGWLRQARDVVPRPAFELLRTVVGADGYVPDFLTSEPSWDLDPAEEAARRRRAPLPGMQVDLRKRVDRSTCRERTTLLRLLDDPHRARAVIAEAADAVWDAVLAPSWSQLERLVRADIVARTRVVTTAGIGAMATALHPAVDWSADSVRVELTRHEETVDCTGRGLVLVPSVFARRCSVITEPPAQPTLFYPALGVAEDWHREGGAHAAALGRLLGEGRLSVLLALREPLSTSAVATATGLAIATASHHLSALRDARLITSRRSGQRMLHARTPLGEALLAG